MVTGNEFYFYISISVISFRKFHGNYFTPQLKYGNIFIFYLRQTVTVRQTCTTSQFNQNYYFSQNNFRGFHFKYYMLLHLYGEILCWTSSSAEIKICNTILSIFMHWRVPPPKEQVATQYCPYSCTDQFLRRRNEFQHISVHIHALASSSAKGTSFNTILSIFVQ